MIKIGLPVKTFRAITLGLFLGDTINMRVEEDRIVAIAMSAGNISGGIIEINKDGMTDFEIKDEEMPVEFGIGTARVIPFAKGCKAVKSAKVIVKYENGKIMYRYYGDRIRYMVENALEPSINVGNMIDNLKDLIKSVLNNKDVSSVVISTKRLKDSVSDVRKYIKSGDVSFVISGDTVMIEGADELSKFGFGLMASLVGKGKRTVTFSMDILKDIVNVIKEAGDTATIHVVEDMPVVFEVPIPGGIAYYATVPREMK